MKNILIAFGIVVTVALLFVAVSEAETPERITIINSGKAGGSFNARTQMYKEGLTAAGYDVRYENVGKISQAVKMFKASDEPTVMVYANNQVYKQDLFHTENNFILAEYQQPLYVCRTNASKGKVTKLTVAHGKGYDSNLLTKILGKNITLVPYKNSGAMLKGMLGGDVDMMVNNQGKSFKYIASGQGSCRPSTVLPMMVATVIGKNIDINRLRSVLFDISMDIPFIEYHTSRKLVRPSSTWEDELTVVQTLEKGYEVK
jgi:ABC-type antimicrobial peptide transport system permease subunit